VFLMFEFKPPEARGAVKVLKGGLLIDGNGGKPVKDPVIVLEGRRIKQVGVKGKVKIPARAEIIDCGTATLMPGMMDCTCTPMMFNCLTFHNYRVAQWEIMPELQQMYGCSTPSSASTWASPRCATSASIPAAGCW
jgi:hypothetical protein